MARLSATDSARLLESLGEARIDADRAMIFIDDEDPRAAIRALVESSALPAPSSLVYGELSLQELYRELYGTEGV